MSVETSKYEIIKSQVIPLKEEPSPKPIVVNANSIDSSKGKSDLR